MHVDPKSHVPIFEQIAAGIRASIASGVYRSGESLPSLRGLAIELRVNPNTVQRAYDSLEREGVINSRRGLGMFVAQQGAKSARDQAEAALKMALIQEIEQAVASGMTAGGIRTVFRGALNDVTEGVRK